jgi:hypothetical protein
MKILKTNLKRIQYFTHGYFAARPEFKGKFLREVHLTLYDMEQQTSGRAYLFLCEGIVLLFAHQLEVQSNVLAEIEAEDSFTAVPNDSPSLTKVLNAYPGFQKTLSVRTSGPVEYVLLNGKYLLLMNIQAGANTAGTRSGNMMTIYLTGRDYIERTENIVKMIREITAGGLKGDYSPLHGTGAALSIINIGVTAAVQFLVPLIFAAVLAVFIMPFAGTVLGAVAGVAIFLLFIAWMVLM